MVSLSAPKLFLQFAALEAPVVSPCVFMGTDELSRVVYGRINVALKISMLQFESVPLSLQMGFFFGCPSVRGPCRAVQIGKVPEQSRSPVPRAAGTPPCWD